MSAGGAGVSGGRAPAHAAFRATASNTIASSTTTSKEK